MGLNCLVDVIYLEARPCCHDNFFLLLYFSLFFFNVITFVSETFMGEGCQNNARKVLHSANSFFLII